jgi:hypothetical protein
MKPIRYILLAAILIISVFSVAVYSGCNKNKCHNVLCLNQGLCDGGICMCPVGFEGIRCGTLSRDKFIYNYNGYDSCEYHSDSAGRNVYSIHLIAVLHDSIEMTLTNLMNIGADSANCTIQSTDSFTFIGSNNSTTYSGSGKLSNDSLRLVYHVQHDTTSFDCKYSGQSLR